MSSRPLPPAERPTESTPLAGSASASSPHPGPASPPRNAAVRYAEALLRWRWPVLVLGLLAVLGLGAGARHVGFDDDYRLFFGPDNPQLQAFEAVQNIYTKNDNILFVIAPESGDVFSRETLAAVEALTEEAWQIPFARRVDSVTNFQHTRANGDELVVEDLVEGALDISEDALGAARGVALAEPLLAGRIVDPDARVTGVNVTLQLPGEAVDETERAVAAARELAGRYQAEHPGLDVRLTGFAMLNNAFSEASKRDLATLVPAMYGAIVVFLVLLFRSLWATVATLVVVGMSTVAAMGAAGWTGFQITPPSSIAPTLILTLAVADSVHFLKGMFGRMAAGDSRRAAIVESLRVNLWPIFLTSATTAVGFLSMNFSVSPPFHDLGNLTAFGVMAAFVLSTSFLPALISLLPVRARETKALSIWWPFSDWVLRHRKALFVGVGVLAVLMTLAVPTNELNDDFVGYFAPSIPFRVDTDFTVDHLTGIYQIEYSLGAGESGGISEPAYLATLERFAAWWHERPGVIHVRTLADTLKRINRSMHGDDEAYYRLPENRELAAQYLLLYELSLPYGLDLNDEINVDKSSTRFTVTLGNHSAKELIAAASAGEAWLRENGPATMFTHGVGPALMFAHLTQRNIESMLVGTFLALILISAILVVALRSWRFGLLSLVPNLAPAGMAFGVWGLAVGRVNVALSMVVAMTLGIVVDDTVHFLSKYLRGRREHGFGPEDSVRFAFRSVGGALWTTSVVLVAGFLVLSLSSFDMNAATGKLTAITIVLALVVDFLLLPQLLLAFDRQGHMSEARMSAEPAAAGAG